MTNDDMVKHLDDAIASITIVREALAGPVPPLDPVIQVPAGTSLQAAVDQAPEGATLLLADGTFTQPKLTIAKRLTLASATPTPPGRATATAPVWVQGNSDAAIEISGSGVMLSGLGVRNATPTGDLVNLTVASSDVTVDRLTGLGDPAQGQRRGIRLHGTRVKVVQCYFDYIFAVGRDTCVLGGWDGGRDLLIDDCYLCGGAETIMFGGGDSATPDRIPQNIRITHCTLTKRPEWFGMGVQIKNAFELKAAIGVYMADCVLEYAGTNEGQGAYLMLFTVRNQGGQAPWSTVQHVLVERCLARYGGGCVQILGSDTNYPSGTLEDVTLRNVAFQSIDPKGLTGGTGRCFVFDRAPRAVTLDAITVDGKNLSQLGYFPAAKQTPPREPVQLTMTNWRYPSTKYGWFIDAGPHDIPPAADHLQAYMPDMVYRITASDAGAVGVPVAEEAR